MESIVDAKEGGNISWRCSCEQLEVLGSSEIVGHKPPGGGGHTPLCFVTTCNNGVFNKGLFMHFSINFPALFVDIKLL